MATFETSINFIDADSVHFENADRHEMRQRAAHFIKRIVSFMPLDAPDYMSEHYEDHSND